MYYPSKAELGDLVLYGKEVRVKMEVVAQFQQLHYPLKAVLKGALVQF